MFKDSLQKRLQEMERESPSPSLENVKHTLKERAGFLGRYVTFKVSKVPQKDHIYGSLEDEVKDRQLEAKFRTAPQFIRDRLNEAWRYAREGGDNPLDGALNRAYQMSEDVWQSVEVPADEVKEIKDLYSKRVVETAPQFIRDRLNEAWRYAREGGDNPLDGALNRAYSISAKTGVPVPQDEVKKIQRKFKESQCSTAVRFIEDRLSEAERYAREGGDNPLDGALNRAYQIAEKYGLEIDEARVQSIRNGFSDSQRKSSTSFIADRISEIKRYLTQGGDAPVDGALNRAKEVAYKTGAQLPTNL